MEALYRSQDSRLRRLRVSMSIYIDKVSLVRILWRPMLGSQRALERFRLGVIFLP